MTRRQLGLVGFLLLTPPALRAQAASGSPLDSTSLLAAIFSTAAVHGQLTAHGDDSPEVICLAKRGPRPAGSDWLVQFASPAASVMARVQEKLPNARPLSACRAEPRASAPGSRSDVAEIATGRRGILVWVAAPQYDAAGLLNVRVGYYEQRLSSAEWVCAVRRIHDEWVVNACRMVLIS